jgi:hypothetical protein
MMSKSFNNVSEELLMQEVLEVLQFHSQNKFSSTWEGKGVSQNWLLSLYVSSNQILDAIEDSPLCEVARRKVDLLGGRMIIVLNKGGALALLAHTVFYWWEQKMIHCLILCLYKYDTSVSPLEALAAIIVDAAQFLGCWSFGAGPFSGFWVSETQNVRRQVSTVGSPATQCIARSSTLTAQQTNDQEHVF